MTNQLTSKFSLYDILSMILPGCVWLWVIKLWFNIDAAVIMQKLGINNDIWAGVALVAIAYIAGLVSGAFFSLLWSLTLANNNCQIKRIFVRGSYPMVNTIQEADIREKYYIAYEYVRQKSVNIEVFSIECQIALLRNIAVPLSLLVWFLAYQRLCICVSTLIALVCFGIIIWAMLLCQKHKYQLVFDCYEYMKRLEYLELCKFE